MNILREWQQAARGCIPAGFVKISREEEFLFVSDFLCRSSDPGAVQEALARAGFRVTIRGAVAYLDAEDALYRRAAEGSFCPPLVAETEKNRRLLFAARLMMTGPEGEDVSLVRHVLRCTAMKDEKALEKLPEEIAVRKRKRQALSSLAGKILMQYLLEKEGITC